MKEVIRILRLLRPKPGEVFVDFGCGADARFCIQAVKRYGCKAVGIEIDPVRAKQALLAVIKAGLVDKVRIINADSTKINVNADVGVAYLYGDVLWRLVPKIKKLRKFVSYKHKVPGLTMTSNKDAYIWERNLESLQPRAIVTRPVRRYYPRTAVWKGQRYSSPVCNDPNCRMCNSIRRQLYGR